MQDEIRAAGRRWSVRMATRGEFEHSRLGWAGGRPAGENISIAPTARGNVVAQLNSPRARLALRRLGAARCDGALFVTVNLMGAAR